MSDLAPLRAFLATVGRREPRFGDCDCALVLADWWMAARGGPDPAADLRGTYATEEECAALLKARGGLPRLVKEIAGKAGAERTDAPKPGDFAVVEFAGLHWGAIMTPSGRWSIKANAARTAVRSPKIIAAWSVL